MLRVIALLPLFALVGSRASSASREQGSSGGGDESNNGHSNSRRPEYLPNLSRLFNSRNASANDYSVRARDYAYWYYSRSAHEQSLTRRPSGQETRGGHPHRLWPSKDYKRDHRTTVVAQEDEMRALELLPESYQQPLNGEKRKEAGGFNREETASLLHKELRSGGRNQGLDRALSSSSAAEITEDTDRTVSSEGNKNSLFDGDWNRGGNTHLVVGEGGPTKGTTTDSSEPILEPGLLLQQQPDGGPHHQSSAQEHPLEVPPSSHSSGASSWSGSIKAGSSKSEEGPPLSSLSGMSPLQLATGSAIMSRRVESSSSSVPVDGSGMPRPLTLDNATCPEILKWTPRIVEPAVIVQVVSQDFILVEKNFVALMEKNSGVTRESILLLCLDSVAVRTFTSLGVSCAPVIGVHDHTMIYMMRVKVLGCLLEAGRDVLLSDSDALWLKDPFEDMREHGIVRGDIVTQRGSYPTDLGHQWGVTMCMGFAFFRSGTEGMMEFQRVFMETLLQTGDDQVGVNHAAAKLGMLWDRHPKESDMRYFQSTSIASGVVGQLPGNFSVTLLPHSRYIRRCYKTKISAETVVAHCLTTKRAEDKLSWMKAMGLWVIDVEPLSGLLSRESGP